MSSGGTRAPSRAHGLGDERPRPSGANASFRSERADARSQPGGAASSAAAGTAHKRSASGNPRRHEERRVTERTYTYEAHVERVRAASPAKAQRRSAPPVDKRASGPRRQRSWESRPRDEAPWSPVVTLLPRTSAPLASRVSLPPPAAAVPQAPQPRPLGDLSLGAQEAAIVEDLLIVLMGHEGQYIRYAKGYDPAEERDRLSGPAFRILPGLDPSLRDLAGSMLDMATHYSALVAFGDVQSRDDFGAVNHALCASVRRLLHDYLVMVAQLETQFLTSDTFTIHVLNVQTLSTRHMMLQLYSLAQELLKRNGLLDVESSGDDDDGDDSDDYDKVTERLTDGGDLLPGAMTGNKICRGGAVLSILTRRLETLSGDGAVRALLTSLLRDASRPYMAMLNDWLHRGAINDAHAEFLVKEQKSIRRERLEQDYTDEYWERRYTVRDHEVPPQLDGVKDRVLLAGKYLNVVRECGGVDAAQAVARVPTSLEDGRFLDNVNAAYAHANESLMQLLLTTHALPARLRSMKRYFFLDPSDHLSYFLELGASELRKPVRAVNTAKLQSLLDLVLRQPDSAVALDPFKEDVKVEMNEVPLTRSLQRVVNITGIEQGEAALPPPPGQPPGQPPGPPPEQHDAKATGFASLQLDYAVPFPVSLVISRKTVWRYQALFRHLLSLRHLESQLAAAWQTQARGPGWGTAAIRRCGGGGGAGAGGGGGAAAAATALERWRRRAWTLRARMLVFVQQLLYYCTVEVIEPNWGRFMARLQGDGGGPTRTVDELMQDHVDFLDTCLKECMLTNSKLLRIHSKLMQTCTIFAAYTNWLTRELEKADLDLSGATRPPGVTADQWRRLQASRASASSAASAATGAAPRDSPPPNPADVDAHVGNLADIIRKWEGNFSRHLQILLDALNHYAATETVVLLSLCARLSAANHGTDYAGLGTDHDAP